MRGGQFEIVLYPVLGQLYPNKWVVIYPGEATWVSNGLVFSYGGFAARTGMGLLAELPLSEELLCDVCLLNRRPFLGGGYWLSPGQQGGWDLVWSATMLFDLLDTDPFAERYVEKMARTAPNIMTELQKQLHGKFGGRLWWRHDVEYASQALALLAHMG